MNKPMISFSPSLSPAPQPLPVQSSTMTDEQQNAVLWTHQSSGNLILEAVAGSGKTFTIIEMLIAINHHFPQARCALMSFNAKVRDELKERVRTKNIRNTEVNTVHGFAFTAFKSHFGPRKPNSYKLSDLLDPLLKQFKLTYKFSPPICQAVSIAKDTGMELFFPNTTAEWKKLIDYHDISWDEEKLPLGAFINLCADLFRLSTQNTDKIDFSDMIWMPLKHGLSFPQFDFVFIDEAQDTNATRREVARRMGNFNEQELRNSDKPIGQRKLSRLIAVGDRHQAIYAFTGADSDSLDLIKKDFSCSELPLSVCFRCSQEVITHAQKVVSHIHAAPNAILGLVSKQPEHVFTSTLFKEGNLERFQLSAILCRVNAPIVSLAFRLLKQKIPCRIEGKDIGQDMIRLCKKVNTGKTNSVRELRTLLNAHLNDQAQKLSPAKFSILEDKAYCIGAVMENSNHVQELYSTIESVFSDYDPNLPPKLTLSSIHKSKGLEWPTVYLLGRNLYMPSKYATQPWMLEQETNLAYVAITRAKETLIEVTCQE